LKVATNYQLKQSTTKLQINKTTKQQYFIAKLHNFSTNQQLPQNSKTTKKGHIH